MNPPSPPLPPASPVPGKAERAPAIPLPNIARPVSSNQGENGAAPTSVMDAVAAAKVAWAEDSAAAYRFPPELNACVNALWNCPARALSAETPAL